MDQYVDIIKKHYPEFAKSKFEVNRSGWSNLVIEVYDRIIFRFPRNIDSENRMNVEKIILDNLNKITNIQIPNISWETKDNKVMYSGYHKIMGVPLTKRVLESLDHETIERVAKDLGQFLSILHGMKISPLPINLCKWSSKKWEALEDDILANSWRFNRGSYTL